jgi:hypothetical protein
MPERIPDLCVWQGIKGKDAQEADSPRREGIGRKQPIQERKAEGVYRQGRLKKKPSRK